MLYEVGSFMLCIAHWCCLSMQYGRLMAVCFFFFFKLYLNLCSHLHILQGWLCDSVV